MLTAASSAVQVTEDEAVVLYGYDMLGSPVAVSDEQGGVLWYENTQPYGTSTERVNEEGNGLGDNFGEETDSRLGYR